MPILTWDGPADQMPNFCPAGCGGVTEDPYGGPCKACWRAVDDRERAERASVTTRTCTWCEESHPENLRYRFGAGYLYFCTDLCFGEWGESA